MRTSVAPFDFCGTTQHLLQFSIKSGAFNKYYGSLESCPSLQASAIYQVDLKSSLVGLRYSRSSHSLLMTGHIFYKSTDLDHVKICLVSTVDGIDEDCCHFQSYA